MEAGVGIATVIIGIDIATIIFIVKDDRYFFDDEKSKLILLVLFLPIIGAIYVLTKLRDDIRWYVGLAVVTLVITCTSSPNRWSLHFCMNILSNLGKVLSR